MSGCCGVVCRVFSCLQVAHRLLNDCNITIDLSYVFVYIILCMWIVLVLLVGCIFKEHGSTHCWVVSSAAKLCMGLSIGMGFCDCLILQSISV